MKYFENVHLVGDKNYRKSSISDPYKLYESVLNFWIITHLSCTLWNPQFNDCTVVYSHTPKH